MSNESRYLLILIPLGLLLAIGWLLISFYGNISYIDREGAFLIGLKGTNMLTYPPNDIIEIGQEVISSQNRLARIIFPIRTQQPLTLSLSLQDSSTENIIRQTTISVTDSHEIVWEFNPIENSKEKLYRFLLKTKTGDSTLSFYTIPPERYDGGTLYTSGIKKNEARIVLDWQYYTDQPFTTLIKRLIYAKPGVFNHQITFIIILLIFGLLQFIIIWWLTVIFLFPHKNH